MRGLQRGPAPACLATDTPETAATHRGRYDDLRYPGGDIKPRWNDLDKDEHGVGVVRRALLAMSDNECAYCGLALNNDHMQVDHILPQKYFAYVSYAWTNLLPTCDACNRRKGTFFPERLRDKVIVEPCLREHRAHDYVFDKEHLFRVVAGDHRLIDPSFDDPADHLELEVRLSVPEHQPKTPIGEVTYNRLFAKRREIAVDLAKIKQAARVSIEGTCSDESVEVFARACGYPSLFRRFVAHWRAERDAGRFPPPAAPAPPAGIEQAGP